MSSSSSSGSSSSIILVLGGNNVQVVADSGVGDGDSTVAFTIPCASSDGEMQMTNTSEATIIYWNDDANLQGIEEGQVEMDNEGVPEIPDGIKCAICSDYYPAAFVVTEVCPECDNQLNICRHCHEV